MTKKDLEGLTITEIKSQYPNGAYKASMKKSDVITTALKSVKAPTEKTANTNTER